MLVRTFKTVIVGRLFCLVLSVCVCALFEGTVVPAYARNDRDHARTQADERHLERLRRIMIPLLQATNHPERLNQARVKIVTDPNINAGSAGDGEFLITTGLLQKANDEQLRGILAHEIAHDDLGHPVKMQLVGTGLSLGAALLEKVVPASGAIAPIAGTLIASSYSRPQELEADRHGVTILRRAGYSKEVMVRALAWMMQIQGNSGGGFLSTHPATDERIRALKGP
ncbi:MAG TPA: M48 family metallopeptidase [Candidatus Binatia bacterium]|nr:M48 family metallopeptidase [Candidatus Binatia bacterium]